MFVAVDDNGKRVYIDKIIYGDYKNQKFFCPSCGGELIVKNGSINIPHFAHKSLEDCDTFSEDMSPWHRHWQSLFPEECREVVIELNIYEVDYASAKKRFTSFRDGYEQLDMMDDWFNTWSYRVNSGDKGKLLTIKHRADVCYNNYVIEFQHSHISATEFNERNWFYNAAGYKVIWIFDFIEEFDNNQIEFYEEISGKYYTKAKYKWLYPIKTFRDFDPKEEDDVRLFFQLAEPENYLEQDIGFLLRVSWCIVDDDKVGKCSYKRFIGNDWPGDFVELKEAIDKKKV